MSSGRLLELPRRLPAVILAGLGALLGACPGPSYPVCEGDQHCKDRGEVCVYGQCHGCALDSHCPEGQVCSHYRCVARTSCKADKDCPAGQFCQDGLCAAGCTKDGDCPANRACQAGRCTLKEGGCDSDGDCQGGTSCREGRCFSPLASEPAINISAGTLESATPGTSGADAQAFFTCGSNQPVRAYFGFNEHALTDEGRALLQQAAACLKSKPDLNVVIQGHTDERGTSEYNLTLGERRAAAAKQYLESLGVAGNRLSAVTLGEERPLDPGHDEVAWAKNRRVELVVRRGKP